MLTYLVDDGSVWSVEVPVSRHFQYQVLSETRDEDLIPGGYKDNG